MAMKWIVTRRSPLDVGFIATPKTGVGKCPMTWEYWTSPERVAIIDHIPNGI